MQTLLTPTQRNAAEQRQAFRRRVAERAAALEALPVPEVRLQPAPAEVSTRVDICDRNDKETGIQVTACNGQVVFVTMKAASEATAAFNRARSGRLTIDRIQHVVAHEYRVTRTDLLSARRTADVVRPRQLAMYLAKTLTLRSLPEIGRRFGGRDHTTVLHAVRKIEALRKKDRQVGAEIESLTATLEMRDA